MTNTEIAERAAREIESDCIEFDELKQEIAFEHSRASAIILRAIEESQQVSENRTLDSDQDLLNAAKAKCASVTEDSRDSIEESQVQQEPSAPKWQVYAPEGEFHGHGFKHSYSICSESGHDHACIALVFGETDREASGRASYIVAKCNRGGDDTRELREALRSTVRLLDKMYWEFAEDSAERGERRLAKWAELIIAERVLAQGEPRR